jgi:HlyD family secretion protein
MLWRGRLKPKMRANESVDSCVKKRNLPGVGAVSTRNREQINFMADKPNRGWIKWTIIIFAAVVVMVGGVWYFKHGHTDAPDYQTVAVARGDLTQVVTATGTLNPVVNVTVGSQVSGRISKLYVDYNSIVKSNEVIAEIDPSTYQAAVEQATADLANAKANLELQQVEAKRSSDLFTNKLVSGSDYDTAIATLHEAEATVKIKQASLDDAVVNLGYCKILSPVDGIVISRTIDLGQTVASSFNTPTLFQIANDLTKMQIDSSVAEADVGGVVEGQSVDFTVDAYPYRTFYGTVVQVRNAPTNSSNVVSYDCVVSVTNSDYKLKPGMTANISFIIAQRENALTIPNAALRFRPPENAMVETNSAATQPATNGGNFAGTSGAQGHRSGHAHGERPIFHTLYVLSGTGKAAKLQAVQVKTGISDGISTEVLSGLNEGARVVTGVVSTGAQAVKSSNPLGGGGFPRMR